MKPQPARNAITKQAATIFPALLARFMSGGSALNAGCSGSSRVSTATGVGEGVPMTRRGPGGSSGVSLISAVLRSAEDARPVSDVLVPPLGGEPQGDDHEEAEAAEPAEEALGDGAGAAQREAARVGLVPRVNDVSDDVFLLGRGV